jgi:hypothetical protein
VPLLYAPELFLRPCIAAAEHLTRKRAASGTGGVAAAFPKAWNTGWELHQQGGKGMRQLLLAGLTGLALMAAVPANAQGFYAGVGPFGIYVGPGYAYDYPGWRLRHYRYGWYDHGWRWRHHYHRYGWYD